MRRIRPTRTGITAFVTASVALLGLAGCGTSLSDQMSGHWAGTCTRSADGSTYSKRDVVNTTTTFADTISVYNDAACSALFFKLRVTGPYTIGDKSAAVTDAYNAAFVFEHVYLTPGSTAATGFFSSASCGAGNWVVNGEQDVYTTGCQPLGFPVFATACKQEYDLAKVDGTNYLNGTRPSNGGFLCTEALRPTTLGDAVTRVN